MQWVLLPKLMLTGKEELKRQYQVLIGKNVGAPEVTGREVAGWAKNSNRFGKVQGGGFRMQLSLQQIHIILDLCGCTLFGRSLIIRAMADLVFLKKNVYPSRKTSIFGDLR